MEILKTVAVGAAALVLGVAGTVGVITAANYKRTGEASVFAKNMSNPNVETPEKTPEETPEKTPEETPEETPEKTPEETPEKTPEETPEETPTGTPAEK